MITTATGWERHKKHQIDAGDFQSFRLVATGFLHHPSTRVPWDKWTPREIFCSRERLASFEPFAAVETFSSSCRLWKQLFYVQSFVDIKHGRVDIKSVKVCHCRGETVVKGNLLILRHLPLFKHLAESRNKDEKSRLLRIRFKLFLESFRLCRVFICMK